MGLGLPGEPTPPKDAQQQEAGAYDPEQGQGSQGSNVSRAGQTVRTGPKEKFARLVLWKNEE